MSCSSQDRRCSLPGGVDSGHPRAAPFDANEPGPRTAPSGVVLVLARPAATRAFGFTAGVLNGSGVRPRDAWFCDRVIFSRSNRSARRGGDGLADAEAGAQAVNIDDQSSGWRLRRPVASIPHGPQRCRWNAERARSLEALRQITNVVRSWPRAPDEPRPDRSARESLNR
jgi:hypothetical protein